MRFLIKNIQLGITKNEGVCRDHQDWQKFSVLSV